MPKDTQTKEDNRTISQWSSVNHMLHTLKWCCFSLLGLSITLCVLCFNLQDKTPIVVKESPTGELYYLSGSKQKVPIKEENIKRFVEKYIELRYEWNGHLNIEGISQDISPFVTNGFRKKTVLQLKRLQNKEFKGKKLDQGHSKPRVIITDKSTTASFDRILRINGIPLPIPTEISFNLVRGQVSYWNRLGLYINGMTIHEGP